MGWAFFFQSQLCHFNFYRKNSFLNFEFYVPFFLPEKINDTIYFLSFTASVPCLPHLAVTITKSSFSRIKFTWNLVGVEHKDAKMLVLTIYEQGIFERTLFWTEDIDLENRETSIAGLVSRK